MTLQPIAVPSTIRQFPVDSLALRLIDEANDRMEGFFLVEKSVPESFLPCDFHLLDQSLEWIDQNHLLAGNRFCELGSGFGVATMLAALRGLEAVGIEIKPALAERARVLAEDFEISARFYTGSFLSRDIMSISDAMPETKYVESVESDVYEEIGLELNDFDLLFAFPWPGEYEFFEAVFEASAADGALLLTYNGREGMNLVRKA